MTGIIGHAITMTAELQKRLREPFAPEHIGKRPVISCRSCREAPGKVCPQHSKKRCDECHAWITIAHQHLDYIGHAEVTNRLLEIDPWWGWEPLAWDPKGLPMLDSDGGLWIRLTIAGVTRLGYGHADGKRGGDAIKETIGDAIRNAAMRFGVGLDLWGATFKELAAGDDSQGDISPRYHALVRTVLMCNTEGEITSLREEVITARDSGEITSGEYQRLVGHAATRLAEVQKVTV